MTADRGFPLSPRVIVGFMVVAFGLALTLDNLDVMEARDLLRYWPFAVIAVGVAKVLEDRERSSQIAGWILVAVGALFAVQNFVYHELRVWRWWPVAIVAFGLMILFRAIRPNPDHREGPGYVGYTSGSGNVTIGAGVSQSRTGGTTEQTLSEFAMWSGIQRRVASSAFKRAELTAVMGGIELDLRQAGTETGEAVVDVFVMWGGIEITVPPDWAVSNQVTPILGGAEDRSTGTQQARHRLIVRGVVIMGGVDIKT